MLEAIFKTNKEWEQTLFSQLLKIDLFASLK